MLSCLLILSRDQDDNFVLLQEGCDFIFRRQFSALDREYLIELSFIYELAHNIEAALEHALNVDLWESRPLCIKLEPLADPLVRQDVKRLDVAVATWLECVDETASELAFGCFKGSLDEHDAGIALNQVLNLTESKLLLLLEQSLDKGIHFGDVVGQLLRGHT